MLSVWSLQTRPNMQADKYVSGCNTFKVEINRITLLGGDVRSLAQIYWHLAALWWFRNTVNVPWHVDYRTVVILSNSTVQQFV